MIRNLSLALLVTILSGSAHGIYKGFRSYSLHCASENYNPSYCQFRGKSLGAVKKQTLSGASCDYGKSWGFSSHHAWVHSGCELELKVFEDVEGDDYQHALCQSIDYQVGKCKINEPIQQMEMVVQLSGAACIEDVTWGYGWDEWLGSDVLWVLDGCSAIFRFRPLEPSIPGGIGGGDDGDDDSSSDDDSGDDNNDFGDDDALIFDLD